MLCEWSTAVLQSCLGLQVISSGWKGVCLFETGTGKNHLIIFRFSQIKWKFTTSEQALIQTQPLITNIDAYQRKTRNRHFYETFSHARTRKYHVFDVYVQRMTGWFRRAAQAAAWADSREVNVNVHLHVHTKGESYLFVTCATITMTQTPSSNAHNNMYERKIMGVWNEKKGI